MCVFVRVCVLFLVTLVGDSVYVRACMRACMCVSMRACVCASVCVRVCLCVRLYV